jgi:hypothetical protein
VIDGKRRRSVFMHAVQAIFRNGRLELTQPVDWPDGTRAQVIPLPQVALSNGVGAPTNTWPPNYFEQTAGALAGEGFERPPQGELPFREEW